MSQRINECFLQMTFTQLYKDIEKTIGIPINSRNFALLIKIYKLTQRLISLQK